MNKERLNKRKSDLSLRKLTVLALDCQATHSNPEIGRLFEIGWVNTQATPLFDHELTAEKVKSHLVTMEDNFQVPKQFLRITGIKSEEMNEAISKRNTWQKLYRTAKKTASNNQGICPAVIHYSRYEEPYLQHLHQEFAPQQDLPFTIVCTHKIVSRLFPGLPRKGLRAVAGYFGYSLPNFRRSLHHVVATAFIWNHVVRVLEEKENITTFTGLQDWLNSPAPPAHSKQWEREYPMEKALRQDLPEKPGIYRMYRSSGDLLYIGKAKSLKHRVNSYFTKRGRHAEHILEMLSQARTLSTTVTLTAFEAAIRESDEIKLQSPPYNRALQPNERQLYFYRENLKNKQTEPNTKHPIGPIPSNIKMESLAKLLDLLNAKIKKITPRLIEELLDCPPEYSPEKQCFISGFETFKKEFCVSIETPVTLNKMMKWGTQFWQEKLIEKESDIAIRDAEETQKDEDQKEIEEGWTPERVFKTLKRKIRMDSYQMRRSRWFCRLSESRLAWTNTNGAEEDKNVLLFENGTIQSNNSDPLSKISEIPPGHQKTLNQRQANFDIATYDRMRIVTTEMRRIIQEGRDIELTFHPGSILNKQQLEKILKWI